MQCYYLNRTEDRTGNSGTGLVAEVAHFDDGFAVVHWDSRTNALNVTSTTVYTSLDDLMRVHGHDGATVLVDDPDGLSRVRHMTDSTDYTFRDGTQVWVTPQRVTITPAG
jgi:hypothetical protein